MVGKERNEICGSKRFLIIHNPSRWAVKPGEREAEMDKRLAFGRIVGRKVGMIESGEIGTCEYWDRVEKTFAISLESFRNKFNPDGICTCGRDSFEII